MAPKYVYVVFDEDGDVIEAESDLDDLSYDSGKVAMYELKKEGKLVTKTTIEWDKEVKKKQSKKKK